ncbi:MAG TPA: RNA 3'-terminal phosphate cyclase [Candidatus Binatia bacterium]|nr:RNA 3'-terminal phosphate cyclase [Candidatus Binatia bacterium]
MKHVDGSFGEGGGQILRSSLALSLITGEPFTLEPIRPRRKNPGLQRQHLTSVLAAAAVGGADTEGAELKSQRLVFRPRPVKGATYRFDIGSAGSTTLVLQTVLLPLLLAKEPSRVALIGGTHNPTSPSFDFLTLTFLPLLERMGARVRARLVRPGFYPAGGGEIDVEIEPAARLQPLELMERGQILARCARAEVARLSEQIARRELAVIASATGWPQDALSARVLNDSVGPGNVVTIELRCRNLTQVFTAFGEGGLPAETVAAQAVEHLQRYLARDAAADEYLTDQLLLPIAIAGAGRFTGQCASLHATTNASVIAQFLNRSISIADDGGHVRVTL